MPSVSSQPFSFFLSDQMRGTKYLCFINGLWKCSHFSLNGKNSLKAKLIIIASVKICLIHSVSTCAVIGICFVDSHFARCIFIWRWWRIPTRLDPSPAKSLYQESLWLQVGLPKGRAFWFTDQTDHIRPDGNGESIFHHQRYSKYIIAVQPQKHTTLITQCPLSVIEIRHWNFQLLYLIFGWDD